MMRKMNQFDKRNISAGLNAAIWPFLLMSPAGFGAGIAASAACVAVTATVILLHDRKQYAGVDWRSRALLFIPGAAYWTLAIVLHQLFG